jgi:hypothetical protein
MESVYIQKMDYPLPINENQKEGGYRENGLFSGSQIISRKLSFHKLSSRRILTGENIVPATIKDEQDSCYPENGLF